MYKAFLTDFYAIHVHPHNCMQYNVQCRSIGACPAMIELKNVEKEFREVTFGAIDMTD